MRTTIEAELEKMLNEYLDEEYEDYDDFEYDYSGNMPCDNTGFCAGISCSQYFKCKGGK